MESPVRQLPCCAGNWIGMGQVLGGRTWNVGGCVRENSFGRGATCGPTGSRSGSVLAVAKRENGGVELGSI